MGASASHEYDHRPLTLKLNSIVREILNSPPMIQKRCMQDYHMVVAKELKGLSRLHVNAIGDDVFFVPNSLAIHSNKVMNTKKDLCDKISLHYSQALSLLSLIKTTYDLEKNGSGSFYGKVRDENFVFEKSKLVGIKYCEGFKKDSKKINETKIDFEEILPGIKELANALSPNERRVLVAQIHATFAEDSRHYEKLACGDDLFSAFEYSRIYAGEKFNKSIHQTQTCKTYKEMYSLSDKPLFLVSSEATAPHPLARCKKMRDISLRDLDAKQKAAVTRAWNSLTHRVSKNLVNINLAIGDLVAPDGTLRHLTPEALDKVSTNVKKLVSSYYLSILSDFHGIVKKATTTKLGL